MKNFIVSSVIIILSFFIYPIAKAAGVAVPSPDNYAQAEVIKIIASRNTVNNNGLAVQQQNLQLKLLSGPLTGQIVAFNGISDLQVTDSNNYQVGDQVAVDYSAGPDGNNIFYITNYIRQGTLLWLLLIFIVVILIIGRGQGLKAILSLLFSFIFIIKVMVPLMLRGINPLLIGVIGSFIILLIIVYLTGGINRKSHVAIFSILLSLAVTAALAVIFSHWAHLNGTAQEEVTYLIEAGSAIDFPGLLLAAIIIGTLGILDDIVVGQVEVVAQIKALNPNLPTRKTFLLSMAVGRAHLGAVVNTLFLAYVGVSLPLILLISLQQTPFLSFSQIINSEQIATEIVRTLVGVIGLSLSVPITTWLAARYLKSDSVGKLGQNHVGQTPVHSH